MIGLGGARGTGEYSMLRINTVLYRAMTEKIVLNKTLFRKTYIQLRIFF